MYTQNILFVVEVMWKLWLPWKHMVRHSAASEKSLYISTSYDQFNLLIQADIAKLWELQCVHINLNIQINILFLFKCSGLQPICLCDDNKRRSQRLPKNPVRLFFY